MKWLCLSAILLTTVAANAQQGGISHGTVYGTKPPQGQTVKAENLEAYMGKRAAMTLTISGKVTNVTTGKNAGFDIDAGNGKKISARFQRAGMSAPAGLKGHTVVATGVASKVFEPDDRQHYAGGSNRRANNKDIDKTINFAVTGLMVDR